MSRRKSFPKTGEDRQLDAYWRASARGRLFTEVGLAGAAWPTRPWDSLGKDGIAASRRLDGVIVEGEPADLDAPVRGHKAFAAALIEMRAARRACEVIEVKAGLSEYVIGQALVGRWLFEHQVGLGNPKTTVLARHQDPAMCWVAERLDIGTANPRPADKQVYTRSRYQYAIRSVELLRIDRYRTKLGGEGTWFTRVPLAGEGWDGKDTAAATTYMPFVRISGEASLGISVFEHRHLPRLEAEDLELVCVSRHRLGRGAVGLAASHALLFEKKYGRPLSRCRLICGQTDLAVEAACNAIGGKYGLPPIEIVEVGSVGASDAEPETDGDDSES